MLRNFVHSLAMFINDSYMTCPDCRSQVLTSAPNNSCQVSGKAPRDFVPHGCSVTTRPGQDGIPLLGVVLQKIGQVVDRVVDLTDKFTAIDPLDFKTHP